MSGKVILVGAGPGDPGLLTGKGLKALEGADVVVYDRLVSPAILARIPSRAEAINVGKLPDRHPVPQHEINRILLKKAQEGHNVVRLKGGDPFVFGRGGEELELLAQEGIDFEVIPGVTSAIAAPAYGGIPVTHRDYASSFHVITGHRRAGKELEIPYEALVQAGGTLIFLMGVGALEEITQGLIKAGMPENTPSAMVQEGTTTRQKRITAPLSELKRKAEETGITNPAVIIVGEVCSLAEQFDWYERLPLKGVPVIVTRPEDRAGELSGLLRRRGAEVLEYPCIRTRELQPCPELDHAMAEIGSYEWLAFTSPAGVEAMWSWMLTHDADMRLLGKIRVAALGPGTARALKNYGIQADYMPEIYDAGHLGAGLAGMAKGPVLMLRAEVASPALPAALEGVGIPYHEVAVYRTEYRMEFAEDLKKALESGVRLATFTSASTVKAFTRLVEPEQAKQVLGVCIGEQTAREARKAGIPVVIAKKATIDALADAVCAAADAWKE